MTLTVRLQPAIESALELYCAERGVTKSLVVQEVLAEYLARPAGKRRRDAVVPSSALPSANFRAFEALGLIGCVEGVGPADKAGVRAAFQRRRATKTLPERQSKKAPARTAAKPKRSRAT